MPIIKSSTDIPGSFKWISGTSLTTGYLLCDGSVVNRSTYPALFNAIGTNWNTGGETGSQFRLPDARGKTPMGAGQDSGRGLTARTLGAYGGAEGVVLTAAQLAPHTHTGTTSGESTTHAHPASLNTQTVNTSSQDLDGHVHGYTLTAWTNDSDNGGGGQAPNFFGTSTTGVSGSLDHGHSYTTGGPDTQHNHTFTTNTGNSLGGGSHNNMQPGVVSGFYIKY